jgi:hypothetical protein
MTSLIDALFEEAGVPALMNALGDEDAVIYRNGVDDDVTLTAVIGPVETIPRDTETGTEMREERTVIIAADPDGDYGGVADPAAGAEVEIDEVVWAVEAVTVRVAGLIDLRCVRAPKTRIHGRGFVNRTGG